MANAAYYSSSYGDVRLFLSAITTDRTRTQVVHELSSGDEHVVQDRGRAPLRTRCTVLFARMREDDLEPLERCRRLQEIVDDQPRIFRHPTSGSYLARIGAFSEQIDSSGQITAELEVIQVAPIEAVAGAGAGALTATGEGAVDAAADALSAELAELDMESPLLEQTKAAVDGWTEDEQVDTRRVLTEVGSLTASLGALAATLEQDIGLWPAYCRTVLLAEAVRAAGDAATSDTAQTFVVHIAAPVALRAVLASVYSADECDARFQQAMALNDIDTPAWLEPGTELLLPQLTAETRRG